MGNPILPPPRPPNTDIIPPTHSELSVTCAWVHNSPVNTHTQHSLSHTHTHTHTHTHSAEEGQGVIRPTCYVLSPHTHTQRHIHRNTPHRRTPQRMLTT